MIGSGCTSTYLVKRENTDEILEQFQGPEKKDLKKSSCFVTKCLLAHRVIVSTHTYSYPSTFLCITVHDFKNGNLSIINLSLSTLVVKSISNFCEERQPLVTR